jgi:hypothetical protein
VWLVGHFDSLVLLDASSVRRIMLRVCREMYSDRGIQDAKAG